MNIKKISCLFLFLSLPVIGFTNENQNIQTDTGTNITALTISKAQNWLLYPIVFLSWKISNPNVKGVLIIRTDSNTSLEPENGMEYPLGEHLYKGKKLKVLNNKYRMNFKDQSVDKGQTYFYHICTYTNDFAYSKLEKISIQL